MIKPKILARGPFKPKDIKIKYNKISKRKIDPNIEKSCKKIWKDFYKKAKDEGKVIYDGTSYRLDNLKKTGNKLEIEISKMNFSKQKPLNIQIDKLKKLGRKYFAGTIGIGGPLITKDNKYILGEKSGKTVSQTKIGIIGGVAEKDIKLKNGNDLFKVVEKEMREETNVSPKEVSYFQFLGIILSRWGNTIFLIVPQLNITSNDVKVLFRKRVDKELKKLVIINKNQINNYFEGLGGYMHLTAELLNEFNPN